MHWITLKTSKLRDAACAVSMLWDKPCSLVMPHRHLMIVFWYGRVCSHSITILNILSLKVGNYSVLLVDYIFECIHVVLKVYQSLDSLKGLWLNNIVI